ncbi:hypothetical protein [Superficieibacter sp.]|uniref:hypothetical protein n=1 Tax=Superficieibacter sp. TaxID=2303322 RepID=UPI0028AB60C6|nr:hypothetical protein [Superficieibacter sp.]
MENTAILLRRLNPYCARALEGAASLCQTRAHAEILPVLSQQLLTHMAAKQKSHSLTLGWSEEEGVMLEFERIQGVHA